MPDPLPELLAAAKRSPTDDALRQAVADHLSANGDPDRGEFVRLQLAQTEDDWRPSQSEEQVAVGRLLKQHVREWAGVPYAGPYWFKFTDHLVSENDDTPHANGKFERGLCRVSGTPAAVREALDRIPAAQGDWLEMLDLNGVASVADLRGLLAHPLGERATAFDVAATDDAPVDVFDPLDRDGVRELRLTGTDGPTLRRLASFKARPHKFYAELDSADPSAAEAVLASPLWSEVREAEIGFDESDAKLLSAFARSPHVQKLTRLFLSGDNFPPAVLRELFASDVVKGLQRLSVSGYAGNLKGVTDALVRGGAARQLAHLDLGFNSITTEEAVALAKSDLLASLRTLDLSSGDLTGPGAIALFGSPNVAGLERLNLSGTEIGEDAVFALAQSPHLKNLRELDLCRCGVTAKAVRALAQSPHLSGLERLDLSINPLAPFALDALCGSRTLGKLKYLGLRQLVIANDTFDRLFRSPVVAQLEQLDLQGTMLSKAKLRGLVEATTLGRLRKVTFGENILMAGEIDVLSEAAWLLQVVDLSLYNTKMTDAGVRSLTAALTGGQLGRLDLSRNLLTDESAETLLSWAGLAGLTDLSLHQSGIADASADRVRRAAWGS